MYRICILTLSCLVIATSSLLPLRVGLAKVYCGGDRYWNEDGHSTTPTILEGIEVSSSHNRSHSHYNVLLLKIKQSSLKMLRAVLQPICKLQRFGVFYASQIF